MQLDSYTLLVVSTVLSALLGVMWLGIGWSARRVRGLLLWSIAIILFGCGTLLGSLRGIIGDWLSIDLANAVVLGATGLFWSAARRFDDKPGRLVSALLGAGFWLVLRQVPEVLDTVEARVLVTSSISGVYLLATALEFAKWREERRLFRAIVVASFALNALLMLVRLVLILLRPEWHVTTRLPTGPWYGLLILEAMMHAVATSFALLALIREREQQRAVAEIALSRDEADRANAAKSRFLARMSHELRTPLNGVLGMAQVLAADRSLSAEARHHGAMIDRAGRHLLALVNDVLDLAQVEAGRVTFDNQPVPLGRLMESALVLLRPEAQRKDIRLTGTLMPGCPQVVVGDQLRLRQVLLNLLGNAVKFTPELGSVRLEIHGLVEGGIRIEVTDTGPGIPPEQRGLLFHDFSRVPGAQPGEGHGLGLAISAGLVEAMGGQIGMSAGPDGRGSRFWANLPVAVRTSAGVAPAGPQRLPGGQYRILVVDDVALNRLVVQALLEAADHEVVLAESGHAAIAALTETRFDLVLMDVQMPEMDGLETTRHIRAAERQQPGQPRLPILALTGEEMADAVQACLDAGMDGHLSKPVDRAKLLARVQQLMQDRASRTVSGAA